MNMSVQSTRLERKSNKLNQGKERFKDLRTQDQKTKAQDQRSNHEGTRPLQTLKDKHTRSEKGTAFKGEGGASQVGGSNQQSQGARQAVGVRNVFCQAIGSSQRVKEQDKLLVQGVSSQAASYSQQSQAPRQAVDARNASSQAASSSQPSAEPSQGPSQHSA
nr:hypothetical protein [Tanacetum cinerariifolium]